jgi:hypothetical protein
VAYSGQLEQSGWIRRIGHLKFNNVHLNFCIFFRQKIIVVFCLFEPTFYETEGRAPLSGVNSKDGAASGWGYSPRYL